MSDEEKRLFVNEKWISDRENYLYDDEKLMSDGENCLSDGEKRLSMLTTPDSLSTRQYNFYDQTGSMCMRVMANDMCNEVNTSNVEYFDYSPFGEVLKHEGEDKKPGKVGFIGKEQDEESSYFQLGVRQYDPAIGRFLSVDPLWEYFPNYNPYHYSYNNPVSFKDPTGLAPEPNEKEDELQVEQCCYHSPLGFEDCICYLLEAWYKYYQEISNKYDIDMVGQNKMWASDRAWYAEELGMLSRSGGSMAVGIGRSGGGGASYNNKRQSQGKTQSKNGTGVFAKDKQGEQVIRDFVNAAHQDFVQFDSDSKLDSEELLAGIIESGINVLSDNNLAILYRLSIQDRFVVHVYGGVSHPFAWDAYGTKQFFNFYNPQKPNDVFDLPGGVTFVPPNSYIGQTSSSGQSNLISIFVSPFDISSAASGVDGSRLTPWVITVDEFTHMILYIKQRYNNLPLNFDHRLPGSTIDNSNRAYFDLFNNFRKNQGR